MAEVKVNPSCTSSFLAFRYVVDREAEWLPGVRPVFPDRSVVDQIPVQDEEEVERVLRQILRVSFKPGTGILLSGGIDSAILAAFLPAGTRAYTIRFLSRGFIDESRQAERYCALYGLEHHVIDVSWADYEKHCRFLMNNKKSPLHPIEAALFKAANIARHEDVHTLVVGNGADSTFGGMDKLLSRDWTPEEFCERYTFLDPAFVLTDFISVRSVYEPYFSGNRVDVQKFLKIVHGNGIIQAFDNAITAAGLKTLEPYERLFFSQSLDIPRIRAGEPKYVLRALFKKLYPGHDIPEKIPFARPMDDWLKDWKGPTRSEFKKDADYKALSGEQRWLIYTLESFLDTIVA